MSSLLVDPAQAARLASCRRLFLRRYEVMVSIGVYEFEKKGEQRMLLNVDLYVPLDATTPRQDRLHEVLDYDFIRSTVAARMAQGHIQLQETLVDDVLRVLLAHPQVCAARVSAEKPDAYPDCDAIGVEVFGFSPTVGMKFAP